MMSDRNVLLLFAVVASLLGVIQSEISDLNPPSNICLCVDIRNCNVRDTACGNVFDQAPNDECYVYTGQKTECVLSGNVVQFFETIYYGRSGWIFGSNLILGTGPECGISDECAQISCQNGGSCYNTLNGSVCSCFPGYDGPFCQRDINECQSNPCLNGATCNDLVNGYACACSPGYAGTTCEMNINECQSNPCLNGATCNDLVNGYACACTPGYAGTTCETFIGDLILRNTAAGSNSYYFYRTWSEYRQGFGTIDSLYWIGLDRLNDLSQRGCAVRFDLQDVYGTWYYAQYSTFLVGDLADYYRLRVGGFTGNIYDSMSNYHDNMQFSTYDYGPVRSCGTTYYGGWWYDGCCTVCLTISPGSYFHWYTTGSGSPMRLNEAQVRFIC